MTMQEEAIPLADLFDFVALLRDAQRDVDTLHKRLALLESRIDRLRVRVNIFLYGPKKNQKDQRNTDLLRSKRKAILRTMTRENADLYKD
jgi:hypothetical protein